jgi:hypothetical protein
MSRSYTSSPPQEPPWRVAGLLYLFWYHDKFFVEHFYLFAVRRVNCAGNASTGLNIATATKETSGATQLTHGTGPVSSVYSPYGITLARRSSLDRRLCQMHCAYRKWVLLSQFPLQCCPPPPGALCHVSHTAEHFRAQVQPLEVIGSIGFVPTEHSYIIGSVFRGTLFISRPDTPDIPELPFNHNVSCLRVDPGHFCSHIALQRRVSDGSASCPDLKRREGP